MRQSKKATKMLQKPALLGRGTGRERSTTKSPDPHAFSTLQEQKTWTAIESHEPQRIGI